MKIVVIGSGPSGVHFALSALEKGHEVTMLDVGGEKPPAVMPDGSYRDLKNDLPDPVAYFVGDDYDAASIPDPDGGASEYYGLPPSKDYVFEHPRGINYESTGFSPLFSYAAGGLAECWTAGSYPLNDDELSGFPIGFDDLAPHYETVAQRVGYVDCEDDLTGYMPPLKNGSEPLRLDESSTRMLSRYEQNRASIHQKHRVRMGRSRIAALSAPRGERDGCTYCGRCILGCPNGALYTPSLTLPDCRRFENFTYIPRSLVSHFDLGDGDIRSVIYRNLDQQRDETLSADAYALACGTLGSSNIVLRSIYKKTGEIISLPGLMDNRQILAPFYNLSMLGRDVSHRTYQYHQLGASLPGDKAEDNVHGQITTLTVASAHPVLQSLPLDLRAAAGVFKNLRAGLGVINLNFSDHRRDSNYVTLAPDRKTDDGWPALSIHYAPPPMEAQKFKQTLSKMGRFFMDIGAPFIPGMAHIRPMGSSVHYSGTMPMRATPTPMSVSPDCQSYDYANLFVVDGAVMPALPAKNLTFTLMANASRAASNLSS